MTSIFDALTQLFTRWGIGLRYIQWCVAGVLASYVGLAVLSVFLSSWGFQWLIWIFLAFYVFGVINLMASPFLWGGVAGTAYVRGQIGGQEGLSIEDGINTVTDWGGKAVKGTAKFLLFYGAVPFIWTALFQTTGWEQETLVTLILLPTVIYFALVRWPNGESVFNIIGYVIIAAVLVGIIGTIYSNVERATTDPATQRMQEYQQELAQGVTKKEADLVQKLIDRVKKHGPQSLSEKEKKFWDRHWEAAQRTESLKKRAETFVSEADPTDAGWWQDHWHYILGAVGGVFALYWFFGRTTRATGESAKGEHTPSRLRGYILLAAIGWIGYSIATGTGQPGGSIGDREYVRGVDLKLTTLEDHRVCFHGIRPGEWYATFPDQASMRLNNRPQQAWGFWVRYQDGYGDRLEWFENVRINNTPVGYGEKISFGADGCVAISTAGQIRDKEKGEPRATECPPGRDDLCHASRFPKFPETRMRLSGKKPGS